ncbi:hypothetical protein B0A52_09075 [Exophiala mesophila]|uniref:uracil phosphoribosyltransferase n=1 Tax=Exophiala mesophila TaxID=212818 RepID=A0A438MVR8_EXOME|nr:hypothetical protein B0A52_09075 [Exophiala mesophila]
MTAVTLKPACAAQSDNHVLLAPNNQLHSSMTLLRNKETSHRDFVLAFQKVAAQLVAKALDFVPVEVETIVTPTGTTYTGCKQTAKVCGISILRAGASLEDAFRNAYNGPVSFGKLLIQRDEETALPKYLYSKFPSGMSQSIVFLLEPMLATGGSICKAVELVLERGVPESNIVIVNVMSSRFALSVVGDRFPQLKIVTAAIDETLNSQKFIEPGLGDFGDRFYCTD